MSTTTIPVATVVNSSSSIISTVPTATIITNNNMNVPNSTVSEIATCRHWGNRFTRPIGLTATCDAYFRCPDCRGLGSKSFGCVIC